MFVRILKRSSKVSKLVNKVDPLGYEGYEWWLLQGFIKEHS